MANIITTGKTFNPTESVTSTKLENIASEATFLDPADETTLELITTGIPNGKLRIKDSGVTTDKLATSSSKTTGVTFAKMQHISTAKVLGRASASEGDVEEVDLLDQDDMSSNSATSVATQQSIKAYVDSLFSNSVTVNKLDSETITFASENSYRDIPDLSVEITPKRANSNFNIRSMLNFGFIDTNDEYGMKCQYSVNNGAMQEFNLPTGDLGVRSVNHLQIQAETNDGSNIVDFNLSTALVNPTYTIGDVLKFKLVICGINMIQNLYFNRSENDTNNSDHGRTISTLTVTEV